MSALEQIERLVRVGLRPSLIGQQQADSEVAESGRSMSVSGRWAGEKRRYCTVGNHP